MTFTEDDLVEKQSQCPPIGSKWRHKEKGTVYTVVLASLWEENVEPVVSYAKGTGVNWSRFLSVFLARFEEVEDGIVA